MSLIGLFGGTFDPVHFGHINCAIELKEKCGLSEVWVIPACCSPFREMNTSPEHRLNMVKLAFEGIEGFKVKDIEINKPPPSYTIDTLRELTSKHPKKKFALLLGEDAANSFPTWKESDEILKMVPLFKARRGVEFKEGFVNTSYVEIEATRVRDRLKKGLYCGHLVPSKVLDYIYKNRLYYSL